MCKKNFLFVRIYVYLHILNVTYTQCYTYFNVIMKQERLSAISSNLLCISEFISLFEIYSFIDLPIILLIYQNC